jgi:four helix bundle protein
MTTATLIKPNTIAQPVTTVGAPKTIATPKAAKPKAYDLAQRTYTFAKNVRIFVAKLPKSVTNDEDCRQLVHTSGNLGANVIEANDAPSKKDFALRIRISRKEARESQYRLDLMYVSNNPEMEKTRKSLAKESEELGKILSTILERTK